MKVRLQLVGWLLLLFLITAVVLVVFAFVNHTQVYTDGCFFSIVSRSSVYKITPHNASSIKNFLRSMKVCNSIQKIEITIVDTPQPEVVASVFVPDGENIPMATASVTSNFPMNKVITIAINPEAKQYLRIQDGEIGAIVLINTLLRFMSQNKYTNPERQQFAASVLSQYPIAWKMGYVWESY